MHRWSRPANVETKIRDLTGRLRGLRSTRLEGFSHTLDPKRPSQMAAIGDANYQSLRRRSAGFEPAQPVLARVAGCSPELPQGSASACVMLSPMAECRQ